MLWLFFEEDEKIPEHLVALFPLCLQPMILRAAATPKREDTLLALEGETV
jgi:hypothetical protein